MPSTIIVGFISIGVTIVASIASLAYWLGKKFAEIDARFKQIDARFRQIDLRFKEIDLRFKEVRGEFSVSIARVIELIRALHINLIDFMSMKGLFTREEREYLIREVRRIIQAYSVRFNPLKPEEAKFILEVMKEIEEKDPKEIDLSKLDRILEIADRWFKEDGCYEAAKLWIIVYTLKRILEKERGEL